MLPLEQARQHLGLTQAAAVLEGRLAVAAQKQLTYAELLADLLGIEVTARRERYLKARTRLAHLPFQQTLEQFDFAFEPPIDQRQVQALACLGFVAEAGNVLRLGPSDVGKTHLVVALGLMAIQAGYRVCFVPAYDRVAATAFFALVSARYQRGSIILTPNNRFADWGEILGNTVIATAILDRLLHQSQVLNIRGESYRLKETRRAGHFQRVQEREERGEVR